MIFYMVIASIYYAVHGYAAPPVIRDYCIDEEFRPDCGATGVIVINYALYGRMKLGTCITKGFGMIGCQANVTDILNRECFARMSCEIEVSDHQIFDTSTCDELRNYLEVSYTCLEVVGTPRAMCGRGDLLKVSSPSSGYLSSVTTKDTGCGGHESPWLVESPDGRTIVITLIDLTYTGNDNAGHTICLVYASIKESGREQSTTLCGGQSKERVVYRSRTQAVQITIVSRERRFLLQYEFVGCAAMAAETGMTSIRDGNVTRVECDNIEEFSTFRCNGTKWMGHLPNCTESDTAPGQEVSLYVSGMDGPAVFGREDKTELKHAEPETGQVSALNFRSITWGMVLIVVGIITGGIVACVFIIAVVYLKRKTIECKGPILVPRPVSEAGYEVCDFDISQCTSSVYRDGYLTVPKDYTPMMNGTLPKYKKPDLWERPLPAEPSNV